jgi:hypothetical protein
MDASIIYVIALWMVAGIAITLGWRAYERWFERPE